jgi:hypothetical protein
MVADFSDSRQVGAEVTWPKYDRNGLASDGGAPYTENGLKFAEFAR